MTPYNDFYVGQQVVCVNDEPPHPSQILGLKAGTIYTLRWVGLHRSYLHGDYLGVRLAGVSRPVCGITDERDLPFRADRFRPVVKDRLATFRSVSAGGPIQGDIEGPKRRVREREEA